jgi:hypothetical protein
MYDDDAADEESRVAATAVVAAGTTTWLLLDGDETEVEDDDDEEEAEAAAEAERVAVTEAKRVVEAEAAEREEAAEHAAHWVSEMDKALAYRRDVDQTDVHRREPANRLETRQLPCATPDSVPLGSRHPCRDGGYGAADNGDGGALQ